MGCTQSKIEKQELISRCKQRKQQLKSAVCSRNALASAHSSYTFALKNTGASLSDYAHGEVHDLHPSNPSSNSSSNSAPANQFPISSSSSSSSVQAPLDNLPPPPPLPDHLALPTPLLRASSLPDLPISNLPRKNSPQNSPIIEEDEHVPTADAESQTDHSNLFNKGFAEQKMTMRRQRRSGGSAQHHRAGSAGGGLESKRGKAVANDASQTVNLLLVLKNLDDHFLRAYENANEVSKMLAATRLHYHSNFADNLGD